MNKVNLLVKNDNGLPCYLTDAGFEFFEDAESTHLLWDGSSLALVDPLDPASLKNPVRFDLDSKLRYHASQNYSLKKEPLAKALGISGKDGPVVQVVDATVGTAKDSMLILSLGAKIIGFERNPMVYLLLKDAERRTHFGDFGDMLRDNFQLNFGSCHLYKQLEYSQLVFYFDPMFKELRNKTKSKKEMEMFKKLVGKDEDAEEVFEWAFSKPFDRVVLKQSVHDKPLKKPVNSFKGKSIHYHLYK